MLRSLVLVAALALPASVSARGAVTTDQCLAKGLCAYVSPKGRVTCGKCPGQVVKTVRISRSVTAICGDGTLARAEPARICRPHGGIGTRVAQ